MNGRDYESVVWMHKDTVHAYASSILRNATEAQDVAQEALVRLWQRRSTVERDGARPWLLRTAHNLCIDQLRKRKVRSEKEDGDELLDRQADRRPTPQLLAESDELRSAIDRALETLGEEDRAVIVMREMQQLPYEEIAKG